MPSPDDASIQRPAFRTVGPGLLAVLILAVAALLFVLRPFSMFLFWGGADPSWMAVLAEAANRPARWGVDLAFTYGPASALVTRYYTDRYLGTVPPIFVAVALAWALCLVRLAACSLASRPGALVMLVGAAMVAAGLASQLIQDVDSFVFALAFAVFLLDIVRRRGDPISAAAVVLGALALAVEGLAKSSFGILAAVLFVVADLRAIVVLRRGPLLVPVFVAGFLVAFLAYGQHLADLPAYLRLQGEVVAGYGAAMYIEPRPPELVAFLIGGAALGAVAVHAAGTGERIAIAAGTAACVLVGLKAGFVRADSHPQIAWGLLGLAGPPVAAGLLLRYSRRRAAALVAASLIVLLLVGPTAFLIESGSRPSLAGFAETLGLARDAIVLEATAWADVARSPSAFLADKLAIRAGAIRMVRAETPLPTLQGTVDILPSAQSAVLAAGLDYHPRPSFQGYGTYTAGLIAANRDFYTGPSAPDWVLFGPETTDDRFPNTAEGALWPILLARYEPVSRAGALLVLHRRPAPLPSVLGAPETRVVHVGERFDVPPGPVFVTMTVSTNLMGRLASLLFRPPALHLRVVRDDGSERTYRFIPAIGGEGFVLAPLVEDATDFARLAFAEPPLRPDAGIRTATITGTRFASAFYGSTVGLQFRRITLPHQDLDPEQIRLGEPDPKQP